MLLLILLPAFGQQEAPELEYPYPKNYKSRAQKKRRRPMEKPKKVGPDGAYYYDTKVKAQPRVLPGLEAPTRIGKDGSYYYEDGPKKKEDSKPKDYRVDSDGAHNYETGLKPKIRKLKGVPVPDSVDSDGAYNYKSRDLKYSKVFYFRGGLTGPFDIRGSNDASVGYQDIYTDQGKLVINLEYEWKLFKSLKQFNFKVGSGFSIVQGAGRFLSESNADKIPRESFQFILFPNTAVMTYKFDYMPEQWVVPYVDAGLGYYTFWEKRSDDKKNNFGGAPLIVVSGGLLLSMDAMGIGVDRQEGYARSWVDFQVRQTVGLDQRKDFTATSFTFGLGLGF